MAVELYMPKIGLTMTEGRLVEWTVKVGDRIEKGDVVFIGETEKSTFEFESPASGILERILVEVDETVAVGTVVGLLASLAEEAAPAATAPSTAAPSTAAPSTVGEGRLVPLTGMRRVIAERMAASRREAAQTEMSCTVDATQLLAVKSSLEDAGDRPTITDLLLKVTAAAVANHPDVNSRWTDDGILYLDAIHLGLAVALDEGLVVPVIRDAGGKSLAEISAARSALVERGRSGRLTPDEMKGSTITVSSLGMLGVEAFTAILNPPESAILAVGAIADRPMAVDKQVVVRPAMTVTLSYDHRVLDGATAARFLNTFRALAESPRDAVG